MLSSTNFTWLWKAPVLKKLQFFLCLCCYDRLPHFSLLHKIRLVPNLACALCSASIENTLHILHDCPIAYDLWRQCPFTDTPVYSNSFWTESSILQWLSINLKSDAYLPHYSPWATFFSFACWSLWLLRNRRRYQTNASHDTPTFYSILSKAVEYTQFTNPTSPKPSRVLGFLSWEPPDPPFFCLNTDGSTNPNPEDGGIGGVLRNHEGQWIQGFMQK